ncbi:MAG: redoxin domain-containing protein [Anaerolineae bacterium]|nr:redoxin domain-containing protein [Anaerolineae bacterium]
MRKHFALMMGLFLFAVSACATAATPTPTAAPTEPPAVQEPTSEAGMDSTDAMAESSDESANASMADVADAPAWQTLPLVNARTGETFTLADFRGKTVLVRAIAEWCTNCRAGQRVWRDEVMPQVNNDQVVFITLDSETNNTAESLAAYAENYQFPWLFAVMTPEFQQAATAAFGNVINAPPSEPQWVIRPDGSFTGILTDRSAQSLINVINVSA